MSKLSERYQTKLHRLIEDFMGEKATCPPALLNSANCHEKLQRAHLKYAAVLVSLYLNMSGSAGDIDLYNLLQVYYRDPEKRGWINDIVDDKPFDAW